jgi:DNA-binding transcriptional LysR family regulator
MEIRDLEYFLACAEEGGFTAAAERVHIVQSAMSNAIARLERELGVRLFDRSATPVALTEHGVALRAAAVRLLDDVQAVRDDLDAVSGTVRGTVVFASTLNTGPLDLASLLGTVRDRHPGVVVRLRQSSEGSAGNVRAVLDGAADIALIAGGGEGLPATTPDRVKLRRLCEEPLVFTCGSRHPLAREESVGLERIVDEVSLRFPPGWGISGTVDAVIGARQDATEVADYALMKKLIQAGFGATLMPLSAIGRSRGVRAIKVDDARLTWSLSAAVDGSRQLAAATNAVLAMLTGALAPAAASSG